MSDVFNGTGVEIELADDKAFLKIRETLTRMGVGSRESKKLYQSCHILHKKGRYAILHFKELFILDGKVAETHITEDDYARRNTITVMLEDLGLCTINNPEKIEDRLASPLDVIVVMPKEKSEWTLIPKYTIGSKAHPNKVKKA